MNVDWFEVVAQGKRSRTPSWLRVVGIREDGRAFVPVAFVNVSEPLACEWADTAGVAVQRLGRHSYAESEWVKERQPQVAWIVDDLVDAAHALRANRGEA
jgi:hypothetical protein